MATINKTMKTFNVPNGADTICYEIVDEAGRSGILLQEETIPDTTQTISFDSSGNVSSIVHKDGSNNTIRSDAFTFGANTITEIRTLYTGETLTIVTNTTTLVTTVTYAAA